MAPAEILQRRLDRAPVLRQPAVGQVEHGDARAPGKNRGAGRLGLAPTLRRAGEHDRRHRGAPRDGQFEQRAAAADLDVVGMSTQAEHLQGPRGRSQSWRGGRANLNRRLSGPTDDKRAPSVLQAANLT